MGWAKQGCTGLNGLHQSLKDATPKTHMLFILQASDAPGNPGRLQVTGPPVRQDQFWSNKKNPQIRANFPRDLHRYANLSFQQGG